MPIQQSPTKSSRNGKFRPGGYGRVIVIDSTHRNDADMRRLGEQLRDENPATRFVSIEVYDDLVQAKKRQVWADGKLPKGQEASHLRHRIGIYDRNLGTHWNSWSMALEGMRGENWPHIEIKYDSAR